MGTRTQPPAAQDLTLKTRNSLAQDPVAAVSAAAAVKSFWYLTVGAHISLLYNYHSLPQSLQIFIQLNT